MVFNGIKLLGPMPVWCQVSAVQSGKPYQCSRLCPTQERVFHQTGCVSTAEWFTVSLGQSGRPTQSPSLVLPVKNIEKMFIWITTFIDLKLCKLSL